MKQRAKTDYRILWGLAVLALCIYLFVTAPPPLEKPVERGIHFPVKFAMELLNEENSRVRALYTKDIVQAGKRRGWKFDENWKHSADFVGPLPAQFLRLTAVALERSPQPLGLYLGSDFPINKVNQFTGVQAQEFEKIKADGKPRFFYVSDIERYSYMFADRAVSDVCITCHNKHQNSPKTDWKSQDVMGATTWTYPEQSVSLETLMELIHDLRAAFSFAYTSYLEKLDGLDYAGGGGMSSKPVIAEAWPRQGNFLPSVEVFMQEIASRNSAYTLRRIIEYLNGSKTQAVQAEPEIENTANSGEERKS